MDLTFEQKTNAAVDRARRDAAEKHFYDAAQPFFPLGFSVGYRNPGHWDIFADGPAFEDLAHNATQPENCHVRISGDQRVRRRAFRIRGEAGDVRVCDERRDPHRPFPRDDIRFRSIQAAMLWICEELMQEPVA